MKERVTTAKGTYWVEEDEIDAIDDDTADDERSPAATNRTSATPTPRPPAGCSPGWATGPARPARGVPNGWSGSSWPSPASLSPTYMARDMWFTSDEWEYLANRTRLRPRGPDPPDRRPLDDLERPAAPRPLQDLSASTSGRGSTSPASSATRCW